jgi:hypothetical protein
MKYPQIASQIFRPQYAQLLEALACIFEEAPNNLSADFKKLAERHPIKTRELWERFVSRGLIPDSWLDDPARRFGALQQKSTTTGSATPVDMLTALCMAADPQGISTAERLAFEVLARLYPWYHALKPQKILWIFGEADFEGWGNSLNKGRSHLSESFQFLLPTSAKETMLVRGEGLDSTYVALKDATIKGWESAFSIARLDISFAHLWERQAEVGKRIPLVGNIEENKAFPVAVRGKLLREFKSPFAALVDLWGLGYAFADFGREYIVLVGKAITVSS